MTTWAWNDEADSEGVGHYSAANTDYSNTAEIQQAYDYVNFSEITPTPVACWPQHEDSGTTIYDLAGTLDGTYSGATLGQPGLLGTTAAEYDGVDDSGSCGTLSADYRTISFWFYSFTPLDGTNGFRTPFGDVATFSNFISFGGVTGNVSGETISLISGSETNGFAIKDTVPANEWHHICWVYDGTDYIPYLDGTQRTTYLTKNVSPPLMSNTKPSFGARVGNSDGYYDGRLADIRIYDVALTQSEIQTNIDVVATQGDWLGTGKTL